TWLSLMLDAEFYGRAAGGYHWTNVLLHLGGTLFLFMALLRMTGALWRSAFAAALFALHPLHVESVAWVAERKDVLSGFFWMLTLYAYAWYAERPSAKRYGAVFGAFACSLMAKPMGVTLPFALLLLDYWPLSRFGREGGPGPLRIVMEKVPLLPAAVPITVLTIIAEQKAGAVKTAEAYPYGERAANALISYVRYLGKTVWPADLAVFYPHPGSWPLWQALLAGAFLLGVSFLAVKYRRRFPYVPVGWFWFLGTLVPAIGVIQIGSHAMADRYTYIPLVGIFIAFAWGLGDVAESAKGGKNVRIAAAGAAIMVSVLAVLSFVQVSYWSDSVRLFENSISATGDTPTAHHGLGDYNLRKKDLEKAEFHYRRAVQLNPDLPRARNNLAIVLMLKDRDGEAGIHIREALRIDPGLARAHNTYGTLLAKSGRIQEAAEEFAKAVKLDPEYRTASENLAKALNQVKSKKAPSSLRS
ncbi:MAG: tetratricopeptide repeat protein, partial [Syntrophales bacterium]|nr:tetratricopeptide repeat protein [Syntrophales bacterium]